MRKTRMIPMVLVLCSVGLAAQGVNTLTAQEKTEGWQLLFDGKTVKGWHSQTAGPPPTAPLFPGQVGTSKPCTGARGDAAVTPPPGGSHWEVVDGALTGCGEPTGYLVSDQSYKNFVLSIEFKCSDDTNSGVFVRSPKENGGYEVQIWKQQPNGFNTGAIVNTAKTAKTFNLKPDQWNHFQITADGDHLVVVLNGETTLDVHDKSFAEGNIRLQYQQYPIAFRNIKIRMLP